MTYRMDHPRSRGVYAEVSSATGLSAGSSPLARGLLLVPLLVFFEVRIIPARAGFTDINARNMSNVMDHPRSRGVYIPLPVRAVPKAGSSPLARGLR